jgi:hypothetical protein
VEGERQFDEPTEEPTSESTGRALKKSDFELPVKILDKTCYGSGLGCSVEYRVYPKYVGPAPEPMGLIEITYEVTGGTEGPQTGTVQIEDGQYDTVMTEDFTETRSRRSKPTAKVTDIETLG